MKLVNSITMDLRSLRVRLQNGGSSKRTGGVLETEVAVQCLAQCIALAVRGDHEHDEDDDVNDQHDL